jgi:thioredoxin reductase (NADPH)
MTYVLCVLLQGLHLVDTSTGAKRDLPVHGMFYGIGHQPNSKLVAGQVDLDEAGYVKVRGFGRGGQGREGQGDRGVRDRATGEGQVQVGEGRTAVKECQGLRA